jgi:amino acid exporter
MEPLLKGIISGITISFLIGPIFLALADITITKGWRSGLSYIAGVLISDIVLIYLVETILQQFPFDSIKTQIGVIGGIMLIVFGIVTYFAKATLKAQDVTSVKTLFQAFLKGVSLNMFNPFVTVWWITMYTTITINYDTFTDRFLFYFGILFMVFLFDLLKMRFAYYLKQRLTETNLSVIKKVVGACLFVFGVVMIVKVV